MSEQPIPANVPDVRKSVIVAVPVQDAFRVFVERPIEWLPSGHTFLDDPRSITIEQRVGGCFRERGPDGAEAVRGTIIEWEPPTRLVLTWRIGANWQPVFDDARASRIELDFVPVGPAATKVVLTHTQLHRHGEVAAAIRSAVDGPSPGETLARYADVVARHASTAPG